MVTEPSFLWLHNGVFNHLEEAILEPVFYWSLGVGVSTITFLFLNDALFQSWFKKIFIWFVPIGLIITFSTRVYGGIPQPGRGETAYMLSILLVLITAIFVAVHLFYDWKRKK
jgi:hypothetical protein